MMVRTTDRSYLVRIEGVTTLMTSEETQRLIKQYPVLEITPVLCRLQGPVSTITILPATIGVGPAFRMG